MPSARGSGLFVLQKFETARSIELRGIYPRGPLWHRCTASALEWPTSLEERTLTKEHPAVVFGRPDELESAIGLSEAHAKQIGAIAVFAGNTEFRLEQAIWRLQAHKPAGVRHATDAKPVGELITMLEAEGLALANPELRKLVADWCSGAKIAFEFRHSIAHGVAFKMETNINFERNRSWFGEVRKRPAASLWGDNNSFENIRLTFAILLRVIIGLGNSKRPLETCTASDWLRATSWARGVMEEMNSGHGPWFEKY